MISETISHYRILKKLGAGGMGKSLSSIQRFDSNSVIGSNEP